MTTQQPLGVGVLPRSSQTNTLDLMPSSWRVRVAARALPTLVWLLFRGLIFFDAGST